jgi:hypothetical protein
MVLPPRKKNRDMGDGHTGVLLAVLSELVFEQ